MHNGTARHSKHNGRAFSILQLCFRPSRSCCTKFIDCLEYWESRQYLGFNFVALTHIYCVVCTDYSTQTTSEVSNRTAFYVSELYLLSTHSCFTISVCDTRASRHDPSAMNSPNRRVLGEKSTNASMSTQEHGQSTKGSMQQLSTTTRTQPASPRLAGTKRRYYDIDSGSFEEADKKHQSARARSGPHARPVIEETDEESESFLSSMAQSYSTDASSGSLQTSTTSVLTSFHPSQELSQLMEEQFEIIQEESQRTLEQIVS
jgi:hypothetical protein